MSIPCSGEGHKTLQRGLRILARLIVRHHLRREAEKNRVSERDGDQTNS